MKHRIVKNVAIIDIADKGKSIGKQEDTVFLVDKAVPGDIVDLEVYRKRKGMHNGRVVNTVTESPLRVNAFCNHFDACGGCKWQHLSYEAQLDFKQKQVNAAFKRIAKVELPDAQTILPAPKLKYYRNKLEFSFSNKKWLTDKDDIGKTDQNHALGFHVAGRFDKVLDIDECYLQHDLSNKIRNFVRDFAIKNNLTFYDIREQHGFLRNIIIRNTTANQWMLVVIFGEKHKASISLMMDALKNEFSELTSLIYIINEKKNDTVYDLDLHTYSGESYLTEELLGMKFMISPKAFFQPNMFQAPKLYGIALEFSSISSDDIVYDLYCGTGTLTCLAAKQAKKVIGIESVADAVMDAKKNAEFNQLKNTEFLVGDMKDLLTENLFNQYGKPDIIIVDPPRMGLHADVVEAIIHTNVNKIVYVSCNPATQARDMFLLKENYNLDKIQAVDMFPYTSHVENVILLNKK